jgi:hypothetical protein
MTTRAASRPASVSAQTPVGEPRADGGKLNDGPVPAQRDAKENGVAAVDDARSSARRQSPTAAQRQHGGGYHERAVLEAEVRRIIHSLRPFGILHRDALSRATHARTWRNGSFEAALRVAINQGKVDKLPGDFCRLGDSERWR